MSVTTKITDSRAVRAFRGTIAEFRAAFGDDMAKRCTFTLEHSRFESRCRYSLHGDRTMAWRAANKDYGRRMVIGLEG